MKAIINNIIGTGNSNFDISVDVFDDNGKLYFSKVLGILCTETDPNDCLDHINGIIKDAIDSYTEDKASAVKSQVLSLIGKEFEI